MKQYTEVRWGEGSGFRAFTVFEDTTDTVTIRKVTGRVDGTAADFARKYSAGEMARLALRDRFVHGVDRQEAFTKLRAWRKTCDKAGLTNVARLASK